jgi:hypothetical protein
LRGRERERNIYRDLDEILTVFKEKSSEKFTGALLLKVIDKED